MAASEWRDFRCVKKRKNRECECRNMGYYLIYK